MCCAIRYLDPASVRWVDDQQQEGVGSGGGDTLINYVMQSHGHNTHAKHTTNYNNKLQLFV